MESKVETKVIRAINKLFDNQFASVPVLTALDNLIKDWNDTPKEEREEAFKKHIFTHDFYRSVLRDIGKVIGKEVND